MQPVNALKSLVNRNLEKLSLRRSGLARRLGYRNVNKGLRRLDALLDAELDDEALLRRVAKVLSIPSWELDHALAERRVRKEKARLQKEAAERADFKPSLTLVRPFPRTSLLDAISWDKRSRIPLAPLPAGLSWENEQRTVFQRFRETLAAWSEESPGPGPTLAGFYYHRAYDHGFLFDTRGNLVREDHHHLDPYGAATLPTTDIDLESA